MTRPLLIMLSYFQYSLRRCLQKLHFRILEPSRYRYLFKYEIYRRCIKKLVESSGDLKNKPNVMFAIVSLNAPDFLLLSLFSIRKFYPDAEVVILDNGSQFKVLDIIIKLANKFGCTLLYNRCAFKDHVLALQYLIDLALTKQLEFLVILDNDVVLVSRLDKVFEEMRSSEVLLAGPRDSLRNCPICVHASLMIVKPYLIVRLGSRYVAFDYIANRFSWYPEPYYSLSYACLHRILYIDMHVVEKFKPLTLYSFNKHVVAYHAWYSSRVRITRNEMIDGLKVEELNLKHRLIKSFLIDKLLNM